MVTGQRLWRPTILLSVATAAFVLLLVSVNDLDDHDGLARGDSRLLHDMIELRTAWLTVVAKAFTALGTGFAAYPLLAVAGVLCYRRTRRWQLPVYCLASLTFGQLVRLVISQAIARSRPPEALHLVSISGFAFPSGHTTNATIAYGLIAWLLIAAFPASKVLWASTAIVLAVGVGLSRIYLGVHWPTDVLGGWLLGAAWLGLGWLGWTGVVSRRGQWKGSSHGTLRSSTPGLR